MVESDPFLVAKASTAASLLVASAVVAMLPWMISKGRKDKKTDTIFSLLNCLSGGVVLGAALSHMWPYAEHDLRTSLGASDGYPYASLFVGFSLLFLWSIEKILTFAGIPHAHSTVSAPEDQASPITLSTIPEASSMDTAPETSNETNKKEKTGTEVDLESQYMKKANKRSTVIRAAVFLVALGLHSVFEGLGLGAEQSKAGVVGIIIAVVSHKALESFALGLSVYLAKFTLKFSLVVLIGYSFCTPLGIVVGMVAVSSVSGPVQLVVSGILVSIALGSFFYVALVEILPNELNKNSSLKLLMLKLVLVFAGWSIMALIAKWA